MENREHSRLVDHLFRQESGKMVAVLVRIFGLSDIKIAEDVVQETFITAIKHWKVGTLPENPAGWLMQVAKRKTIDILRQQDRRSKLNGAQSLKLDARVEEFFHEDEIADSQLRLIFACCHPELQERDKIALTLKIASGFSIREISRALLKSEDIIKQRLSRARKFIRENNIELEIPSGKTELRTRLNSVLRILYLVYNEGYYSAGSEILIRKELCAEAIRLAVLLTEQRACAKGEVYALLALMCFQSARFDARINGDNQLVLLPDQDRSKWDEKLTKLGSKYIANAFRLKPVTVYHLEAAIAAQHAFAEDYASTDWPRILKLYNVLCEVRPSPTTELSRAVVMQQVGQYREALDILDTLDSKEQLVSRHLLCAAKAESYLGLSQIENARECLAQAKREVNNPTEIAALERKISAFSN